MELDPKFNLSKGTGLFNTISRLEDITIQDNLNFSFGQAHSLLRNDLLLGDSEGLGLDLGLDDFNLNVNKDITARSDTHSLPKFDDLSGPLRRNSQSSLGVISTDFQTGLPLDKNSDFEHGGISSPSNSFYGISDNE